MSQILVVIALLAAGDEPNRLEEKRGTLPGTLTGMIDLLEEKKHAELIREYAHPEDLKRLAETTTLDKVVERFADRKAEALLENLKAVRQIPPTLSENGTQAAFEPPPGAKLRKLEFELVGGKWYIRN